MKSARNGDDLCLEGHHGHNVAHVEHGEEQDFLCLAKDFSQKESSLKEKVLRSENYITIFYKIISFSSMQIPEFYESLNSFSGSPTLSRFSKGVKSAGPFELMTSSKCCPRERTIWPTRCRSGFLTKNEWVSKINILERQPEMLDEAKRHQDVVSVHI